MVSDAMFSSDSVEWETPPLLFKKIEEQFGPFDLDPCATHENHKTGAYFTEEMDGLNQRWHITPGRQTNVFMNPPYKRKVIDEWTHKAMSEARTGDVRIVALIPARTDTGWWHYHVWPHVHEVHLVMHRVKFLNPEKTLNSAPFPSAIVVYDSTKQNGTLPVFRPFVQPREPKYKF